MKHITTALLLCCLLLNLCACANINSRRNTVSENSNKISENTNPPQTQNNSSSTWVGRYDLERLEFDGSIFYAKDFERTLGLEPDQYILLKSDYTGKVAVCLSPGPVNVETCIYNYDAVQEKGSAYVFEYGETFEFQIKNDYLTIDASGALLVFKKQ